MTDPTTYSRMTLRFASPFPTRDETEHEWTCKFNLSGAALTSQSDAEATAMDLWSVFKPFVSGDTSFIGWLYYPPGSAINSLQNSYAVGAHIGDSSNWTGTQDPQQLEVCVILYCPVGINSKGRAKYLRKFVHDVPSGSTRGVAPAQSGTAPGLGILNTGAGPNALVPVDPHTGVQGGPWHYHQNLYTRQLRRGYAPKA